MAEDRSIYLQDELAESQAGPNPSAASATTSRVQLTAADIMKRDFATIGPDDTAVSAAETMTDKNMSCLIVSENGKLRGIVTETDILKRAVGDDIDVRAMRVEHIMASPVRSISPGISVIEAGEIMEAEMISRLVVVDDGLPVGAITQTDIIRVVVSYALSSGASEIMTTDVGAMPSYYSIASAGKLLEKRGIRRLVVVDHNILRGVITQTDILKAIKNRLQQDEEDYLRLLGQLTAYSPTRFGSQRNSDQSCVHRIAALECAVPRVKYVLHARHKLLSCLHVM